MQHRVRFEPSGTEIDVPSGTSLLEAARRAGLPIASACGAEGLCARCGLRLLSGAGSVEAASAAERDAIERNRIDADLRLACRIPVRGDLVVTTTYW